MRKAIDLVGAGRPHRFAGGAPGRLGGARREVPDLRLHERRAGIHRERRQDHSGPRQGERLRRPVERRPELVHRGEPRPLPGGGLPRHDRESAQRRPGGGLRGVLPRRRRLRRHRVGGRDRARLAVPDRHPGHPGRGQARAPRPRRTRSPIVATTRARTCPSTGTSTTRTTTGPPTSAASATS